MLRLLRKTRRNVGVTQEELATRLDETQTFISKCERGERRIDVIELRKFCEALGIPEGWASEGKRQEEGNR